MSRTGGQILVDQLELHGVDLAFGVPGESYLAVLDALVDSPIRYITTRHEVGAANMAEAYGKLTGRPGICLVTRGPGATHASGGIHTAFQDSTPLLLLIGQVARGDMGRDAFQEIDYRQHVRADGEVGGADRRCRPDPRARRAGVPRRHLRPARARSCWRCPRTCSSTRSTSRTRHRTCRRRRTRPPAIWRGSATRWPAPSGRSCSSAARPGATTRTTRSSPGPRRTGCPSRPAGAARGTSTTRRRSTPGISVSAPIRGSRSARAMRTCCWRSEPGWATSRRGAYAYFDIPKPRQRLIHVLPDPEELGRVFQPEIGDRRIAGGDRHSPRRARAARRVRMARRDGAGACRLPRQPASHAPGRARASTWAR